MDSGQLIRSFEGQADEIFDVKFSPDGKLLVSGGAYDGIVKVWDATVVQKQ